MTDKVIFITATGAGTFTVPADFGSLVSVECIGGGATGSASTNAGGGGGAYALSNAVTGLLAGGTAYVSVGAAGADTWFNAASNAAPTTTAQGALAKAGTVSTGGSSTTSVGTSKFSGGNGGTGSATYNTGGGGGGAGGPSGTGKNGGNGGTAAEDGSGGGGGSNGGTAGTAGNINGSGGAGGNGLGGTGGGSGGTKVSAASAGTAGTGGGGGGGSSLSTVSRSGGAGGTGNIWTQTSDSATAGPGGGGGGGNQALGAGGGGGLYGSGGGGAPNTGGAGGQGLIVFTYTIVSEILLDATAAAKATATAALTTAIQAASSAAAKATATAALTTAITLAGSATGKATATADLYAPGGFSASASARASASAALTTAITLAANAGASASATAAFSSYFPPTGIVPLTYNLWLAEITAYDPGTAGVITWRFASGNGYDNAGTWYAPRIENPASFSRSIGGSSTGGRASASYGELTLINNDGALNALADDYFDGRTLTLKVGNSAMAYGSFQTVLVATIETVAMERERVSVRLRDRAIALDTPFSTVKYAGTNSLPNGIEGTPDNLQGQAKPRIIGRIALMTPVAVNTSKLIYQVNAGAVDGIINVFDAGAYLTRTASDYSSQSDMENNAPAAGSFRTWPAGGCFRLGSSPYGALSVCVAERWLYTDNTAAGLTQRILTELGYTASDWVAADFTALNQANAGSLGVIVGDSETTASLIDRITQSVGAWWGFDRLNRFRVARLDAPSGSPAATFTDSDILDLERQPESMPANWRTTIKADTNYSVQDKSSLAGVVTLDRAAWFEQATRDQQAESAAVKTARLLAEEVTAETLINGISIAAAEAARRLALYSVRRDLVTLTVADPLSRYSAIDIGSVVNLTTTKLGYGSGKLFTVIGLGVDYQRNTLDLTLWG